MAVIRRIPGLQATIKVDGRTVTEYDSPDADDTTPDIEFHVPVGVANETDTLPYIVKYIEAKPGALFRIHVDQFLSFQHHSHHIGYQLALDNITTGFDHESNIRARERNIPWESSWGSLKHKDPEKGWQKQCFRFAALDVEDAGDSWEGTKDQISYAKRLGVIRVKFYYLEAGNERYERPARHRPREKEGKVAEKALKGRAVDCTLDWQSFPASPSRGSYLKVVYADKEKREPRPFAVYEFRYRSMDGLIKEGIVPRPRNDNELVEVSSTEPNGPIQMTDAKRIKTAVSGDDDDEDVVEVKAVGGIKREREERKEKEFLSRYKTRRLESGVMEVDLTDD